MRAFVLALALLGLAACDGAPERPRKVQTVRLLPDTPPPPPPPRQEDRPPPRPEAKPQPQDAPKPVEQPQAQALKEEGPAGNGPGNGLSAGTVTQDYTDQRIGTAIGGSAPDSGIGRLTATSYGNATTRALNEFLTRERTLKQRDYQVRVELWLGADGALRRAQLVDSTGDGATDDALRAALDRFPGNAAPPPAGLPQPVRVRVSNRMMG